jgi:hypothetical protein
MEVLQKANDMHLSWIDIIAANDDKLIEEDLLTSYQVWALRQRCSLLCLVLNIAKEKMPPQNSN